MLRARQTRYTWLNGRSSQVAIFEREVPMARKATISRLISRLVIGNIIEAHYLMNRVKGQLPSVIAVDIGVKIGDNTP